MMCPTASRRFPKVHGDTPGATCARISPLYAVRAAILLAQFSNLDVHLYYAAVQNLIYGCGNVPQITPESTDKPPIHCVQHVQQSVDTSIELSAGL